MLSLEQRHSETFETTGPCMIKTANIQSHLKSYIKIIVLVGDCVQSIECAGTNCTMLLPKWY